MPVDPKDENTSKLNPNPERKKTTDPHFKGLGNHEGALFWVSLWVNINKDGSKWIKFSTSPRQQQNLSKMVAEELGEDPLAGIGEETAPELIDAKAYVPSYQETANQGLKRPASTHQEPKPEDDVPF